jgi:hypothetical protein
MYQYTLTEEESDDLEVARFMAALPMEVQRLSDGTPFNFHESQHYWRHQSSSEMNPTNASMVGHNFNVGYHRSNLSQTDNPRKRRSVVEKNDITAFDAAAIVTKMYEGGSFSDEEKDRDGTNSFHGQMAVDNYGERPPKRLSSSSGISSCPVPSMASMGENARGYKNNASSNLNLRSSPDINNSVMSAACAAVIAKDAEKRYEARLNNFLDTPIHEDVHGSQNGRKFKRRAGFSVPNNQLEAAAMLSERTDFAGVNCAAASMIQKQNLRRSSFSTFANLRNDLIGTMIPKGVERSLDCYDPLILGQYNNPYIQNPVVPKMQRRANSLPDRNAIYLFSQNYTEEGDRIPDVMGRNVASNYSNMVKHQYGHPLGHRDRVCLGPVPDVSAFSGPNTHLQNGAAIDRERTPDAFGNRSLGPFATPFTPFVPFSSGQDALVASIQANLVLSDIVKQKQHVDGTCALGNSQVGAQNCIPCSICSHSKMSPTMHPLEQFYNEDNFDGKQSDIFSIPISLALADDHEIALLLHEACKKDDLPVIGNILQKFPLSARWSLIEKETGDVPLHIGK